MNRKFISTLAFMFALGIVTPAFADDVPTIFSDMPAQNVVKKNKKMNAKVETRRIAKGTRLKLQLLDNINTNTVSAGHMFNAALVEDEKVKNSVILPQGTLVRGYVQEIKPAKLASIGAILYLNFDHIVTPSATQLPIKSYLTNNSKVTYDGGIREQSGYGDALKENWAATKDMVVRATKWGFKYDNASKYALVPIGATGGAIGGGLYMFGDSLADVFKKGKPVDLKKGDILEIVITKDLDVPVI